MPTRLNGQNAAQFFEGFHQAAFRLETLDHYSVPAEAEAYERFLRGEPAPASNNEDWCKLIRRNVEAGKVMERVHIISIPLTQYVRFEIEWGYVHNQAAGEKIYLVDRSKVPEPEASFCDFWLFDDEALLLMSYDRDGKFIGIDLEDRPTVVSSYRKAATVVKSLSAPLDKFLRQNRLTE